MIDDIKYLFDHDVIDVMTRGFYSDFIDNIFNYDNKYKEKVECINDIMDFEPWLSFVYGFVKDDNSKTIADEITEKAVEQIKTEKKEVDEVDNKFKNVGRNDPCPCGTGKKFKKCCIDKVNNMLPYQKYITDSLKKYPKKTNNTTGYNIELNKVANMTLIFDEVNRLLKK